MFFGKVRIRVSDTYRIRYPYQYPCNIAVNRTASRARSRREPSPRPPPSHSYFLRSTHNNKTFRFDSAANLVTFSLTNMTISITVVRKWKAIPICKRLFPHWICKPPQNSLEISPLFISINDCFWLS